MLRTCVFIASSSLLLFAAAAVAAQDQPLRIIAFGAHPDDCDIRAGGTAAKWAALGHKVRFVSVTNGDAGHHEQGGGQLAMRRRAEAQEAGRRIGVEYVVLDNHDGELVPDLKVREQIIRQIREWKADLVLAPRPNDYHPDHRYTGVLLQDAAFMVTVPNVTPDTPALRKNPGVPLLRGPLPEARAVPPGHRGVDRRRDRQEDRHAGRPRVADVRVAAVARRLPGGSAEGPCGAEGVVEGAADPPSRTRPPAPLWRSGMAPSVRKGSRTSRPLKSVSTGHDRMTRSCGGCSRSSAEGRF